MHKFEFASGLTDLINSEAKVSVEGFIPGKHLVFFTYNKTDDSMCGTLYPADQWEGGFKIRSTRRSDNSRVSWLVVLADTAQNAYGSL